MRAFLFQRGFILPVTVTGLIPVAIVLGTGAWRHAPLASLIPGAALYAAGLSLLLLTTGLFDRHHGSLAPWNPPTELIVEGPYRHCRNPMISGIYAMLLGEALAFYSPWLAAWFGAFALGMGAHIVLQEEPALRRRFGAPYERYCAHVPRWLPRRAPYAPPR